MTSSDHWETIKAHDFTEIVSCDIMDEEGEIEIPVHGVEHLQNKNIVGSHIQNYDSMLVLSHFKGHAMGGFGGALKNMSIGVASSNGKAWIHSGVSKAFSGYFEGIGDGKFLNRGLKNCEIKKYEY